MATDVEYSDDGGSTWTEIGYSDFEIEVPLSPAGIAPEATVTTQARETIDPNDDLRIVIDGSTVFEGYVRSGGDKQGTGQWRIPVRHDAVELFEETIDLSISDATDEQVLDQALTEADASSFSVDYQGSASSVGLYEVENTSVKRVFRDMMDARGYVWWVDPAGSTITVAPDGDRGTWMSLDTQTDTARVRTYNDGDVSTVRNDVTVLGAGGFATASDATSISNYGRRTGDSPYLYPFANIIVAQQIANQLLIEEPLPDAKVVVGSDVGAVTDPLINYEVDLTSTPLGVSDTGLLVSKQTIKQDYVLLTVGRGATTALEELARRRDPDPVFDEAGLNVDTLEATGIADTVATLQGELVAFGDVEQADVYFQYKTPTASSWTETARVTQSVLDTYQQEVTGLTAGQTYEWRAVALDSTGTVSFGRRKTFTTTNDGTTAPTVTTDAASNVGSSSVDLNGTVSDFGDDSGTDRTSVDVFFEYVSADGSEFGVTSDTEKTATGSFTDSVSNLTPETTYKYRAAVRTNIGVTYGDYVEFTTASGTALTVTTDSATSVGDNEATLNGTVSSFGSAQSASVNFNYRPQGDPTWDQTTLETITTPQSFADTVDQLVAGTTYEYQARASTSTDSATGTIKEFTTTGAVGGVIEDWEDNDTTIDAAGWSGWTGDTAALSTTSSALSESYSGELTANGTSESVTATANSPVEITEARALVNTDNRDDTILGDSYAVLALDNSGTNIMFIRLHSDGGIQAFSSGGETDLTNDWSINTTYELVLTNIDYSAETFDAEAYDSGGTLLGSATGLGFRSSVSGVDEVEFLNDSNNTSGETNTRFDDITVTIP